MIKILIVEDDLISRRILNKALTKYGIIDLVVDGLEALDAFIQSIKDSEPYDLICLDIMMPKIDGIKVLKTIREIEGQKDHSLDKTKIIMTTALAETELVNEAFELGCDAYAPKPIDLEKLTEVLLKLELIMV